MIITVEIAPPKKKNIISLVRNPAFMRSLAIINGRLRPKAAITAITIRNRAISEKGLLAGASSEVVRLEPQRLQYFNPSTESIPQAEQYICFLAPPGLINPDVVLCSKGDPVLLRIIWVRGSHSMIQVYAVRNIIPRD